MGNICNGRPPMLTFEGLITYLPLILLTFLLAGMVKGVVGLGLPTIAVGLLGLVMTPMQAAALLIMPSMAVSYTHLTLPTNREV